MIMLFVFILFITFFLTIFFASREKYNYEDEYKNALIKGQVVAGGSVFSLYPENVPGLGWVL